MQHVFVSVSSRTEDFERHLPLGVEIEKKKQTLLESVNLFYVQFIDALLRFVSFELRFNSNCGLFLNLLTSTP